MSKIFTLENYQKKADETYGSFTLEFGKGAQTTLRNPLRVDEKSRERVFELVDELQAKPVEGEDGKWQEVGAEETLSADELKRMEPLITEFLTLVGDANTPKLLDVVKGDLAVLMNIFQDYFVEVGLGEASSSPDA